MSRSGYSDDIEDTWRWIMWRGAVASSIRGRHGQAFLRELIAALDAMPVKSLVEGELQADGEFCALGVVGQARGIDLTKLNTEDWRQLSDTFGIAETLAREIMYENDECSCWDDNQGTDRWSHVRRWAEGQLAPGQLVSEASRSQKMRKAGFTRRPSAKSLPSDE